MVEIFWIAVALFAGALLPTQAAYNTRLGESLNSSVYASLISFAIGTLALLVYVLVSRQTATTENLRSLPAYIWSGGVLGAVYVTLIVVLYPRLGPSLSFCLVVLGQLVVSLIFEHFKILTAEQHLITWPRVLGVVLVIAGIYLMKRF